MLNSSKLDTDTDYNLKKFERFSKMYALYTLDLLKWILDSTERKVIALKHNSIIQFIY